MVLVRSAAAASTTAGAETEEIRPVMLADAEHIEANLIGEFDLFHEVAQTLRRAHGLPGDGSGVFSTKV